MTRSRIRVCHDLASPSRDGAVDDPPPRVKLWTDVGSTGVIARAPFGSTGHESSRVIFGGASLSHVSRAEAARTLDVLLEHGVNHLDTAASYGDSELHIATWLKRNLDLIQLHNLVDVIEWELALREGGALDAAVEAREEGLVGSIGVTGHGSPVAAVHRRSLERFAFDSVLLPYNFVQMRDPRYATEFERLASTCAERGVAVQTIKSIALAPWDGRPQVGATWYEPMRNPDDIELAVHWVLGRDGVFLNAVGDVELLPHVLGSAERFETRPSDDMMQAMIERRSAKPLFV